LQHFLKGIGAIAAKRPYTLGALVREIPEIGILLLEHIVQPLEMPAFNIPVKAVGLEIQHKCVGQYVLQALYDLVPGALGEITAV
jgi:hypothetical protein